MGLRLRREEQLRIVGMHCATCELTVSNAIRGVRGVEDVRVNLASGEARVVVDDKRRIRDIVRAVRRAGYDVVTQRLTIRVDAREEEMGGLREMLEGLDGVIEAKTGGGLVVVEINPLETSPGAIIGELGRRGYRARIVDLRQPVRSDLEGLLPRLVVAAALTPLVVLAPVQALRVALSVPVQFYSGLAFYRGMVRAIRNGTANMDVLVSLSSTVAWLYGLLHPAFLPAASMLIAFVLLGKTLEAYLKGRVTEQVVSLQRVKARRPDGTEVDAFELRPGDVIVVRAGEVIPADGVVDDGEGYVDESVYTGESLPARKSRGDPVIGGSVLTSGYLKVYVTRAGERAYISQVLQAVREAEAVRLPIQGLADRIAEVFVPVVLVVAVSAFLVWRYVLGSTLDVAVMVAVSVLASACPCGFGLATPMAVVVGLRRLLSRGVVVRNGEALERLMEVDTFVFDKTGTVTKGRIRVARYEGEVELAAALERLSGHPIASAIAALGRGEHEVSDFVEFPGEGVYGKVDGRSVVVGRREFVLRNCDGDPRDADVLVCVDGRIAGYIWLEDEVREEAVEVVRWLKEKGYRVVIATGDSSRLADRVGEALGVEVYKGLSPEEKADLVRGLRAAFVGDGVNDAIALRAAVVGIALSGGSDMARLSGDVIVPSLKAIPALVAQAERTVRKIKENLAWAMAYNMVLIPIAAGVLHPLYLPPQYAALAMSMSSVGVVLWGLAQ